MMAEIFARGPIACEIDATPLHDYTGGVLDIPEIPADTDHIVAIAGWGETKDGVPFWLVRNSWGEYWGEGGWFRLKRGENQLLLESNCAWAVPGSWTELAPPGPPRPHNHHANAHVHSRHSIGEGEGHLELSERSARPQIKLPMNLGREALKGWPDDGAVETLPHHHHSRMGLLGRLGQNFALHNTE
ncbi:unnamed protein product [Sphacelaria rigidula]